MCHMRSRCIKKMNHYITTYAAHFNIEHRNHSGGDSVALGVARASEGTGNVTGDRERNLHEG